MPAGRVVVSSTKTRRVRRRVAVALAGVSSVVAALVPTGLAEAAQEQWTPPGTAVFTQQGLLNQLQIFPSGGLDFSPDGSKLYATYTTPASHGLQVLDAATGAEILTVPANGYSGRLSVAPDGRIYVTGRATANTSLAIFDPVTYTYEIVPTGVRPREVAIVSDTVAYATLNNTTIVRIEKGTDGVSAVVGSPIDAGAIGLRMIYDPATKWLWHLASTGVRIYDTVAQEWRGDRLLFETSGTAEQLALDPVRQRVIASWGAMRTRVYDSTTGAALATHVIGKNLSNDDSVYDPATGTLYAADADRGLLREVRLFSDPVRVVDHEGFVGERPAVNPVTGLIYLPDSQEVAVGAGQIVARTESPTVTADPSRATIELGLGEASRAVSFEAAATGTPAPTVQWQSRPDADGEWSDIAGATGSTLELTATAADSGRYVRAVFTNSAGALASAPAKLVVTATAPPKGGPPPIVVEPPRAQPSRWPAISAPKRASVGKGGAVTVATVSCRQGRTCSLSVPKRVRVAIGGKAYSAKLLAPKRVAAGRKARLRLKLPEAARAALAGRRADIRLRIVASAGDRRTADTVVVTVTGKRRGGA